MCPTGTLYSFKTEATHQVGCTRENVEAYIVVGHNVYQKGKHKIMLPVTPVPGYE